MGPLMFDLRRVRPAIDDNWCRYIPTVVSGEKGQKSLGTLFVSLQTTEMLPQDHGAVPALGGDDPVHVELCAHQQENNRIM